VQHPAERGSSRSHHNHELHSSVQTNRLRNKHTSTEPTSPPPTTKMTIQTPADWHRQLGRAVRGWKDRLTALELWRGGLVGTEKPSYKGFRFPAEIISHCVWLYHRFPLSLREVEEMMLQRGVTVSHESIRQWCAKFGQSYANGLRRRRHVPGTSGTLIRCSSKSRARPTTCGGRSISTGPCWTSWSP